MAANTTPDLETLSGRLRALSDPSRLRILDRLRGGERCVCELTDVLDTGQSLLSFHLKVLRDAGLVTARRDGRWMHYAVEAEALEQIEDFLASLRRRTSEGRWTPVCCE